MWRNDGTIALSLSDVLKSVRHLFAHCCLLSSHCGVWEVAALMTQRSQASANPAPDRIVSPLSWPPSTSACRVHCIDFRPVAAGRCLPPPSLLAAAGCCGRTADGPQFCRMTGCTRHIPQEQQPTTNSTTFRNNKDHLRT